MRGLRLLPLFIGLVVLGTAAAPPPKPTAVIAGLGQQTASDGRYYSTLFPYSIKSTWHGATFADSNGKGDRFVSGQRHLDILSFQNTRNFSTSSLVEAAQTALKQDGFSPKQAITIKIQGEKAPILVFSNQDGAYAELVFVTAGRAWVMALISDSANAQRDLAEFVRAASSFRLEHGGQ